MRGFSSVRVTDAAGEKKAQVALRLFYSARCGRLFFRRCSGLCRGLLEIGTRLIRHVHNRARNFGVGQVWVAATCRHQFDTFDRVFRQVIQAVRDVPAAAVPPMVSAPSRTAWN